ncbi:3-hydroxyacyl-CoA dehydrogenase NAD-binding domain-containing protein [Microvirga puerhi]|uniref:Enoyl-CoA hydratase/isomerase family protein n=1 Tax=Microvirga puerhi TaxID=2876078 RepID=A0ABS7VVV9_9HYPH|nr:3-hydroxyacyl-CoA dehydrogenase NAD-binding domain-containing protein [Microvirga puerhi]MBZ6079291.1 enoyl-CoA hydratase/isomerase family protein [Microvirga puerhi]
MTELLTQTVSIAVHGDILVATTDNPPVNALSHSVRAGLGDAIATFESNDSVRAMILICAGRTFFAGADIREFGKPMHDPLLGEIIARLDGCSKPIIAAIHGTALGGGLEVALACSYRVAAPAAKFGLPEVKLGILPGAGGSLRLPRLIGVEAALSMISEGRQVSAAEAIRNGLIDAIFEGDLKDEAIGFARRIIDAGAHIRRASDLFIPSYDPALFEAARASMRKKFRGFVAPQKAVDLVEMAARMPFAEACEPEYATCKELLGSPQSKALRHMFVAEREALKIGGVSTDVVPRDVRKVAVVGPGTMGRGITVCLLDAGLSVVLIGLSDEGLSKAQNAIAKIYDSALKRGSLSADEMERRLSRLTLTQSYNGLADVDLAIEAVTEDIAVKAEVFRKLDNALRDDAIVATNTSFLDIDELARASRRPQNVAGMHFFNPAHVMKLVENVRASHSTPDVLATITTLARKLGKMPVMVGRSEGFVANRMLSKRTREAQFLLEEGATPAQIDRVLSGFGFPIGPFALADLAGMDIMAAARATRLPRMSEREKRCNIVDRLVAAGRLGQKTGAGYYRYDAKRTASLDPEVDAIIESHRRDNGIVARVITDEEILERCLYAMINEAAKILEEGAAARPGDIDVIWTNGFGFPTYLGGPMFHADRIGVRTIKAALDHYSTLVGREYFQPTALIERLATEGKGFYG